MTGLAFSISTDHFSSFETIWTLFQAFLAGTQVKLEIQMSTLNLGQPGRNVIGLSFCVSADNFSSFLTIWTLSQAFLA